MYYIGLILQIILFVIRFDIQTEAQGLLSIIIHFVWSLDCLLSFVEEERCEKFSQIKTSDPPETVPIGDWFAPIFIHQIRLQFVSIGLIVTLNLIGQVENISLWNIILIYSKCKYHSTVCCVWHVNVTLNV